MKFTYSMLFFGLSGYSANATRMELDNLMTYGSKSLIEIDEKFTTSKSHSYFFLDLA